MPKVKRIEGQNQNDPTNKDIAENTDIKEIAKNVADNEEDWKIYLKLRMAARHAQSSLFERITGSVQHHIDSLDENAQKAEKKLDFNYDMLNKAIIADHPKRTFEEEFFENQFDLILEKLNQSIKYLEDNSNKVNSIRKEISELLKKRGCTR